ncbi:hypothetical protein RB595_009971 [Gaeumannomyces hyphopodioides]
MAAGDPVYVVKGFSLVNRLLLYASAMLAPAQFVSGVSSSCPTNLGFLAYNFYTQIQWYNATRNGELHALSLILNNFNALYAITYLGGTSSGNKYTCVLLALGTAAVVILNNVTAWVAYATNMLKGYGVYQFFFFGWRTLDEGWRGFLGVWVFGDTIFTLISVVLAFTIAIRLPKAQEDRKDKKKNKENSWWDVMVKFDWALHYLLIPAGAVFMLLLLCPTIIWSELIIRKNNIKSETDWTAVGLFVLQVVSLLMPCGL